MSYQAMQDALHQSLVDQAYAALAVIDRIQDEVGLAVRPHHDLRRDLAFGRLAAAMDELFGPLPAGPLMIDRGL